MKDLKFPILFHGSPLNKIIYENFSYHAIAKWELLHKDHDFPRNIQKKILKQFRFAFKSEKF